MSERDEIDEIIAGAVIGTGMVDDGDYGERVAAAVREDLAAAGYSIVPSVPVDVDPDIKIGDGLKKVGE